MQFPANLVTFTEEILNGKLHFLCSVISSLGKLVGKSFNLHSIKQNEFSYYDT